MRHAMSPQAWQAGVTPPGCPADSRSPALALITLRPALVVTVTTVARPGRRTAPVAAHRDRPALPGRGGRGRQDRRGLRASRNQSPTMFTDSTSTASARPGRKAIHHSPEIR